MEDIIVGIDIGTTKVCTLIGNIDKTGQIQILGKGLVPFNGAKKGVIIDIENTSKAIEFSVEEAEKSTSLNIGSAYVNIYGTHVNVLNHKESVNILSENQVITTSDLNKLYDAIEMLPIPEGNQIIDIIPRQYIIDGYGGILEPLGMSGLKLEIDANIVTGKLTSVQNIIRSVEKAGLEIDGLIIEALATSEISLSPEEKEMGVILIDVGGGITDVSAFKNGKIVMYDSIPVGGEHITNDISIGLNISYSEADKIKRQYELALTTLIKNDQEVSIYDIKEEKLKTVQVSQVIEIIEARVYEILSLAKNLVEKYENIDEFNSGIVLTGGGISYVNGNKQIGEEVFNLPVRVASYRTIIGASKPEMAAAAGIIQYVNKRNKHSSISSAIKEVQKENRNKLGGFIRRIVKAINKWFFL